MANSASKARTADFQLVGNSDSAQRMAANTGNQFDFLGVLVGQRRRQSTDLVHSSKQWSIVEIFSAMGDLFSRPEREYQYVAIDIAIANVRRFDIDDMQHFCQWITVNAWRDTGDNWRQFFSKYLTLHREQKPMVFALFFKNDNIWLRRIAILLQINEDFSLDTDMLSAAILYDRNTDDKQIQLAIGRALRTYSKYNPVWVRNFLRQHGLSMVAAKEARRYLLSYDFE